MNVLMMSNTYAPHVGGVARSITRFARHFRARGHRVRIIAPEFDGDAEDEDDVLRVLAVRHFNHTDFSLALPLPRSVERMLGRFEPDLVHAHHPFLIGGMALRIAHAQHKPLVFTHHTRYEDYTHNVPGDSAWLKRFVVRLATNYANLCDHVFVPSESIAQLVTERGVKTPVSVVPTGVDTRLFEHGERLVMRSRFGIPEDAFVVGHLGRLTREKNIPFLIDALLRFVGQTAPKRDVRVLVFGGGPLEARIAERFAAAGLRSRLVLGGVVPEAALPDAYHAMDLFAFASTSETQGMVLTEAMACGLPVVAIDASGVRELVEDGINGRLLPTADVTAFATALESIAGDEPSVRHRLAMQARLTAGRFSVEATGDRALAIYDSVRPVGIGQRDHRFGTWTAALQLAESEWALFASTMHSATEAMNPR